MSENSSNSSNQQRNYQLPRKIVAKEFGEVNVKKSDQNIQVEFTILMEPQGQEAEGWQTGVALDASASMRNWYGRSLIGSIPESVNAQYEKKGWVKITTQDGKKTNIIQPQAYKDAINKGYLKVSDNIIQPLAQDFISYLASSLDADGGTTVIYWAGDDGSNIEVLGDLTESECKQLQANGPSQMSFGSGTILTPAVKYFVERFTDSPRGMYVFITDGKIEDLEEVKKYTAQLAKQIESGQHNSVKCVLIGVGDEIDKYQLEELDDFQTETEVDIWDHKIAEQMTGLIEIFAEVADENQIVAPTAIIYDSAGNIVKQYADGLPAKVSLNLPLKSNFFELEVYGQRIRQRVISP